MRVSRSDSGTSGRKGQGCVRGSGVATLGAMRLLCDSLQELALHQAGRRTRQARRVRVANCTARRVPTCLGGVARGRGEAVRWFHMGEWNPVLQHTAAMQTLGSRTMGGVAHALFHCSRVTCTYYHTACSHVLTAEVAEDEDPYQQQEEWYKVRSPLGQRLGTRGRPSRHKGARFGAVDQG